MLFRSLEFEPIPSTSSWAQIMPSALQPSLDFPNEIWIEILTATVAEARPVLHYFDLKRVAGVSQKFKALIQVRRGA